MPDQSKKANQPKKNETGNNGEPSQPANGKPSGSSGNSSTQTTSGGGGNAQATLSQPESPAMKRYKDQKPREETLGSIVQSGSKPKECPEEISEDFDKKLNEPTGENQPGNDDNFEGKGEGNSV
ncbi:hypothetical protein Forpe1208_v006436 [Fusarium oxysporum f. sp. rapae]|uniref:Uncharacterized protein n=1 Tax=Fusarium oxysporum f. sp. rapae TaxID=485398 RepID=A0A8J5PAW0_FUSOX|nr:hypothetical protein Forpe1208_v006436 [Fusarium oxysporum f. sp. rapae]